MAYGPIFERARQMIGDVQAEELSDACNDQRRRAA